MNERLPILEQTYGNGYTFKIISDNNRKGTEFFDTLTIAFAKSIEAYNSQYLDEIKNIFPNIDCLNARGFSRGCRSANQMEGIFVANQLTNHMKN